MRINWIFADDLVLDPTIDVDQIKNIGATWGSWRTWRGCGTDNVLCHDLGRATELLGRAFQAVCNFHVPKKHYQDLGRPLGVKLYDGDFDIEVDHVEEIVAMHLVSVVSDIVLMMGFDLGTPTASPDRFVTHKITNYHGLVHSRIKGSPDVQWVLVDHAQDLAKSYQSLPNLTCDKMSNVLQLLT
jgi:hypothetical protein